MQTTVTPLIPVDFEFAALQHARNYRGAVFREFADALRGHVLEAGAGSGQMTQLLVQHRTIEELVCLEPEPRFCALHRQLYPEVRLIEGTVAQLARGEGFDAILSVNVLEHIEDDEAELKRYAALLATRRGLLCLFVPARPELYSRIDRDFGHHRRYTRAELRQKLSATGLRQVKLRYFNLLGYFGWALNFRLAGARSFSPALVRAYDTAIFPFGNFLETHLLRPPFGQSLVAIAQAL